MSAIELPNPTLPTANADPAPVAGTISLRPPIVSAPSLRSPPPPACTGAPVPAHPATVSGAADGAPSPGFLSLIPHQYARRHLLLSAGTHDNVEHLRVLDRTRPTAVFNVRVRLGRDVTTTLEQAEAIATAIDRAYEQARSSSATPGSPPSPESPAQMVTGSADIESDLAQAVHDAEADLLNLDGKAPSVRLVDLILFEALQRDASDVHIQPVRGRTLVRYRLDGALHTARELPGFLAATVVSRVKVMARLDVAEHRAPQDGRAAVTIGGSFPPTAGDRGPEGPRRIDLRVSTLPSTYGERVVLRLLDPVRSSQLLNFSNLGMPPPLESRYLEQVVRTTGIVLSTGPTGSGKTTTLYTTLSWLSAAHSPPAQHAIGAPPRSFRRPHSSSGCELNMMTIEDPVEYDLSSSGLSISQTQVDPKKKVTFATGLRHILRQDPDVIMVGEIRDEETARVAVQASLTGHLVLSTLHTNDAPSAIIRLIDLGVEPFLVASALAAILAQRLVRKVHQDCGGTGCSGCLGAGYKGRTGVFELLVVDHAIRALIAKRPGAMDMKTLAEARGMVSLREAGASLVRAGLTTTQEVARVIDSVEELDA